MLAACSTMASLAVSALSSGTAILLLVLVSGPDSEFIAAMSAVSAAVAIAAASWVLFHGTRWQRIAATALCITATIDLLLAPFPVPPHRLVTREESPDGELIAEYSWRPAGILGAVTGDNPWVYVTIRTTSDDRVVARHKTSGDVPEDAVALLSSELPWTSEHRMITPR